MFLHYSPLDLCMNYSDIWAEFNSQFFCWLLQFFSSWKFSIRKIDPTNGSSGAFLFWLQFKLNYRIFVLFVHSKLNDILFFSRDLQNLIFMSLFSVRLFLFISLLIARPIRSEMYRYVPPIGLCGYVCENILAMLKVGLPLSNWLSDADWHEFTHCISMKLWKQFPKANSLRQHSLS